MPNKKKSTTDYTSLTHKVESNTSSNLLLKKDLEYVIKGIDDIKEEFKSFKEYLEDKFVSKDRFRAIEERIEKVEETKNWSVKLIIGTIFSTLVGLIVILLK